MTDAALNQTPLFKVILAFLLSLVIFISVVNTLYIVAVISGFICLVIGLILALLLYAEYYSFKHS